MVTISRNERPYWTSLQFRFGLSYILVILGVLLLLNTYPLLVSEDLVFRSKATNLQSSVSVMVNALSGLSPLTEENVSDAMAVAEEAGLSRILVTDGAGRVLYDTRETGSAVGNVALYTEIVQALLGYDAFSCTYQRGAFRSRASSPVMYQSQIIGAVYAYEYDTEQAALLSGLQETLLRLSAVVGALVLILSLVLSKALTHKISLLLNAIRQVREGAYSHRADIRGRDEIAQIGHEFNSLTDRLQTTETARRRFVSDASHELKTPLAAIRLLSDSILQTESIDRETTKEFVTDIGREAERLSRITEDLLRLTRLDSGVLDPPVAVDILPVLEQVMRMMNLVAQEKGVDLTYSAAEDCVVLATKDEIHQVIYNLTDNAVKYSAIGGSVQVSLGREGEQVILAVSDNGAGIPEADLPRIFERFYRVDKARSRAAGGTGLGLSIVSDTVKRRGGSVEAANRSGGGAVFTVRWPALERREEP
ncbi:MAG: HAMP domain-containing sensor histidine kinase [Dysosmobacter sp.]|nr:HAMP domain-containing sensor histidine kinase [Dysosmobacter sp.]